MTRSGLLLIVLMAALTTSACTEAIGTEPKPQPAGYSFAPTVTTVSRPPAPKPRVAVFGDSTALMSSFGLAQWLETSGRGVYVEGRVDLGCGIVRQGLRRDQLGQGPNNPICQRWDIHWREMLEQSRPDIVMVQVGPWDIIDHLLEGDTIWRAPGDPVYDAMLQHEMLAVVDLFASRHVHVAWLTLPRQRVEVGQTLGSENAPGTDPARSRRFNELLAELPEKRPGAVTILDLAAWLTEPGRDQTIRPDGIHVTFETTYTQAAQWLGDALISAFEAAWSANHRPAGPCAGFPGSLSSEPC
ncbi:MAG: SGNH/GDSL hydrolase family protein [Acidimicrobiales bacterium]|nr:SGNH/GDSL hydrolase family protein [Acidimicrobiales bacterium]